MTGGSAIGGQGWASDYFEKNWTGNDLRNRAKDDRHAVLRGSYSQVFEVPTEPLEALIQSPGAGDLIQSETIEAANIALFRIVRFNQLVRQQTEFYALHLAEIRDNTLPCRRRVAIARAAQTQSRMLHEYGIGEANKEYGWYCKLKTAIGANIKSLKSKRSRRWWLHCPTCAAFVLVALMVAIAVYIAVCHGINVGNVPASDNPTSTTTQLNP